MIRKLIDEYPSLVSKKDKFDRFPLHIAVDSKASIDVIKLLLNADKAIGNFPTKHLRMLPLHIALKRGWYDSLEGVLRELLAADDRGLNIYSRTAIGRLPLHIAIEKKLPTRVIKMFLNTDTVHVKFNGRLPIHIACFK